MRGSRNFLSGGGGGVGGGVQAPQLILQFIQLYYSFSCFLFSGGGGGPIANFYRNPYNYNLRFSRGESGPPIPPLDPHMDNVAFWHEYAQTSLCGLLLSLETSNANWSIVFERLAKALIRLHICAGWS